MKAPAIEVLYEDEAILVVNKPAGLLTIPDRFVPDKPNLQGALSEAFGRVFTVHRLDRETSGAICFARTEAAHRHLSMQFENRETEKTYLALLEGRLLTDTGSIDAPIVAHPNIAGRMITAKKGKAALTDFTVITRFRRFTLVQARIKTGRTHQIRVHFLSIGHPLAIDEMYSKRPALFLSDIKTKALNQSDDEEARPLMQRISLHALRLTVEHPSTGAPLTVEAPLPKDFRALIKQLEKWGG